VIVTKGEHGSVEASELRDADHSEVGELRPLERDLAILLAEEHDDAAVQRDRGDRPRLLGRGHEPRGERRDDRGDRATGARIAAMTGATAVMIAATAVPDPGCYGDGSRTLSALDGTVQLNGRSGRREIQ
jgi:hypothetical protein